MAEKSWTDEQIQRALNTADGLVANLYWNMSDGGAMQDFLNVHANAFLLVLRAPDRDWSLDDVLNAGWVDSDWNEDYPAGQPAWVRNWH